MWPTYPSPVPASSISASRSATGSVCWPRCSPPAATMAARRSAPARRSTSNMSPPIRPGRCMSAIAAAPWSATRSPTCSALPATTLPRNTTSTTPARRSTCSARSAFLRYREALGEEIGEIPAGLYPGDYLVPVGQALAEEFGSKLLAMPEDEWLPIVKERTIDAMMVMIREDLAALNVHSRRVLLRADAACQRCSRRSARRSTT